MLPLLWQHCLQSWLNHWHQGTWWQMQDHRIFSLQKSSRFKYYQVKIKSKSKVKSKIKRSKDQIHIYVGFKNATIEVEFSYKACCNDEDGLSSIGTTKLEASSCSERTCFSSKALPHSSWISKKVSLNVKECFNILYSLFS